MNFKLRSFICGFIAAIVLGIGGMAAFSYFYNHEADMSYHAQVLSSGKTIKVTMCNFLWGGEHSDRYPDRDLFGIEYVMSCPDSSQEVRDREALEVFELIRPISEQWKMVKAEVTAFPTLKRKGTYYVYLLEKNQQGKWDYKRYEAKVHNGD
jgi:hypothetical protein